MSTRRTTLHLPVRYTLAPGADETRYLRTLADQAADRIEAAGSAAATIEAGEPAIDPPADARPHPEAAQ